MFSWEYEAMIRGRRFERTGNGTAVRSIRKTTVGRVIEFYTVSEENRSMQHTLLKQKKLKNGKEETK